MLCLTRHGLIRPIHHLKLWANFMDGASDKSERTEIRGVYKSTGSKVVDHSEESEQSDYEIQTWVKKSWLHRRLPIPVELEVLPTQEIVAVWNGNKPPKAWPCWEHVSIDVILFMLPRIPFL
jgi:hypothetical protein